MLQPASGTIFSFLPFVPPHIESDEADPGLLDAVSFVHAAGRGSCALQRITAGGALLRTATPIEPGERLGLELTSGLRIEGTVAWRNGSRIGVSFDSRLDVVGSIARDLVNQPDERRRMPRIELRCTACVQTRQSIEFATTRDISQGGIRIETGLPLAVGEVVEISLDGLPPLTGEVRWRKDEFAGVRFTAEIGWQALMPWVRSMSRVADRPDTPGREAGGTALSTAARPIASDGDDGRRVSIPARVREGTRRWNIVVGAIDEGGFEFSTLAAIGLDTLIWLILPELEGWPARIVRIEGDRFVGAFAQPLRPDVLERIRAGGKARR